MTNLKHEMSVLAKENACDKQFGGVSLAVVGSAVAVPWVASSYGFIGLAGIGSAVVVGLAGAWKNTADLYGRIDDGDTAALVQLLTPEQVGDFRQRIAAAQKPAEQPPASAPPIEPPAPPPPPATAAPSAPVAAAPPANAPSFALDSWLDDLRGYPSILVFGAQGSGKTSFLGGILRERPQHHIYVLDPHASAEQWQGLTVVGKGMDYAAVDDAMRQLHDEVAKRYRTRAEQEGATFAPITYVCEELTNWASRCRYAAEFFRMALSDIRKVNVHVIFVSHARTMTGLGDAKGLAATRDAALLEIELLATIEPGTKRAFPAFEGKLKRPGGDWQTVKIPRDWMVPSDGATSPAQPVRPQPTASPDQSGLDPRLIELVQSGWSQNQIVAQHYGVKGKGSKAYQKAVEEIKQAQALINGKS